MGRKQSKNKSPTNPVTIRRNRDWTHRSLKQQISMSQKEANVKPKKEIIDIPQVKFARIFTKQKDGKFLLTAYKCSLCEKVFGDYNLTITHPKICSEVLNNYR